MPRRNPSMNSTSVQLGHIRLARAPTRAQQILMELKLTPGLHNRHAALSHRFLLKLCRTPSSCALHSEIVMNTCGEQRLRSFVRQALSRLLVAGVALVVTSHTAECQLRLSPLTTVFSDDDGLLGLDEWSQLGVGPRKTVFMLDTKREGIFLIERPGASPMRIGRRGSGPGEYVRVAGFGWLGDTLWVSDDGTRRVTFFDQLGKGHVRTHGFTGVVTTHAFMSMPLALTPNGSAICPLLNARPLADAAFAALEPLGRISRSGSGAWDTLFLLDPRHRTFSFAVGKGRRSGMQPMSDATLWAISRNGQYAVKIDRADDARIENGTTVTLLRTTGAKVYQLRLPRPTDAVTTADIEDIVQRNAALFQRPTAPPAMRDFPTALFRQNLFRPRYRIPVTEVVLGDDGTVLLRGNDWTSKNVVYTWLTPTGGVRGTFTVPVSQYVRAVLGDDVWSVAVDADGVGSLVQQRAR